MKKMKHFMKGLFAGAIFGTVVSVALINSQPLLSSVQEVFGQEKSKDSNIVVDQELVDKLQLLELYVDEAFLMEKEEAQTFKDNIYKAYMDSLGDPYSVYYTEEEYEALMESTSGVYSGIGVVVSQDAETKQISAVRIFENSPGAEAGLLPGDIILKADDVDLTEMDLSTAVSYIKGEEQTTVRLQIYRPSTEEYLDLDVVRRRISVPTIEYEMLEDSIGYIQVTEFDEVTADQYIEAVEDLKSQGMQGLIVDLRDNPGGLLNIVVEMLDYMLPQGTITYTEDKYGQGDVYTSDAENYFDLPLVVLVNGNSASASEIFTGAIKDYEIGTIVGTTTFGKGIVQHIYPLEDNTAIKLTVSKYFTPNGTSIHEVGIEPDVVVELDESLETAITISKEEDNQLQEAISVLKQELTR